MIETEEIQFNSLYDMQVYLFADFKRFLTYALSQQGLQISKHQLEMADFLTEGHQKILIMAARGWSKTETVAYYLLWRSCICPDTRIRIVSSTGEFATQIVGLILKFARSLPVCKFLVPDRTNSTSIRWKCSHSPEKEDNVSAVGIESSKMIGPRCDILVFEDIETPATAKTREQRQRLDLNLNESNNILHPQHYRTEEPIPALATQMIVVGTPHSSQSIYKPRNDEEGHPMRSVVRRTWKALDENGESTFKERFSTDELLKRKADSLPHAWEMNMMMNMDIVDERSQILNMTIIKNKGLELVGHYRKQGIQDPVVMKYFCYLDPAYGCHDETAYCIAGICKGLIYIKEVGGWVLPPDKALAKLLERLQENRLSSICLETNLPDIENVFKTAISKQNYRVQIESTRTRGEKYERMAKWLGWSLNNGQAIISPEVLKDAKTFEQLAKFSDIFELEFDDRIDVISIAIADLAERLRNTDGTKPKPAKILG